MAAGNEPGQEPKETKEPAAAIRHARTIALATMASRVLGLVRDKVTVYFFPQATADAIVLAWTIPNLFRRLFGEGALSASLVPVLAETERREGREGRNRVARSVIWSLIATLVPLTIAIVAALMVLPDRWFLVFFDESKSSAIETLRLLRWTMPFLVFICVAGQMQAVANLAGRFFVPALAPAIGNVTWIVGALVAAWLAKGGPADPTWVAVGMLAGGVLQVAIQWIELLAIGENCMKPAPLRTREVAEVSRRMAPMLLGLAAGQINVLVDNWVAQAVLPDGGAVSQLYLANRLMQLPLGVVGVAMGTAIYPALARAAARDDKRELGATLGSALRTTATLCLPSIFGLMTLAAPIMGLLFEGGQFTAAAAESSGACMAAMAPTLFLQTAVLLLARAEYARGRQRRPVAISAACVAINAALDFALAKPFGAAGIATSTTIATLVNAWFLMRGLELDSLDRWRELARPALRVLGACVAMGIAVVGWRLAIEHAQLAPFAKVAGMNLPLRNGVLVGGAIALGLGVFLAAARLVARAEFDELMATVRQRRAKSRRVSREEGAPPTMPAA